MGSGVTTALRSGRRMLRLLAVQGLLLTSCLACPPGSGELVGDLDNCHIFYQCDFNPQPRSCGDMMFNTINQVCDWPNKVMQIRPECRDETKLGLILFPFYRQRTLRMIQLYGNGDRNSARRYRAPQEKQRSALLHVTTERGNIEEEANLNLPKTHIYNQV